jgi:predicted negative regulator of RcsB-dependent stress response
MQKALQQINNDAVVYSHYGDILLKKGRERDALDAYKKSFGIDAQSEEGENVKEKIKMLEEKLGNKK